MQQILALEMNKAQQAMRNQAARLTRAKSLREVRDLSLVRFSPLLRPFQHSVPGYRQFEAQVQRRARELVDASVDSVRRQIEAGATVAEVKETVAQLHRDEWVYLRGNFPQIAGHANRSGQELVVLAERAQMDAGRDRPRG